MKTQIKIGLSIFSLFWLMACSSQTNDTSTTSVSPDELEQVISDNENLVILDVRTPEEYSEGHIKDAVLIDFMGEDFQKQIENLDKSKTYAVYCKAGGRQQKASVEMEALGFEKILLLDGGITSWTAEGKPVEK